MLEKNRKIKFIFFSLLLFIFLLLLIWILIYSQGGVHVGNSNGIITANNNVLGLENWEQVHKELFTVSGKFVCLPVKDASKAHNDLCVFGLQDGDHYYRLQKVSEDNLNILNKIKEGQNIEIKGVLMESINDEYESLATIKVSGVRFLETDADQFKDNLLANFHANYISFQNFNSGVFRGTDYPASIDSRFVNGEIDCDETAAESSLSLRVSKKEINGKKYCISAFSEGAAGSVYTQYAYTTAIDDYVYLFQFLAHYPHCSNYPDKERLACEKEREIFDLDALVDQEIETIRN